ncbi:MAG: hypothetical protein U0235_14385 [Polyangiaceae bacterium]
MTYDDRDLEGSEVRLWKLIEERSRPGISPAEIARIDERIWDLFGEEWAIVFTDLSGFSRQVAAFGIVRPAGYLLRAEAPPLADRRAATASS